MQSAAALAVLTCMSGVARLIAQPVVVSRTTVYQHPGDDPYDPANRTGFNHAANIVTLPGGRLMASWFSGPFEASVHQVILASYSADQGATWSPAQVFHDFPRRSGFDPAFLRDGGRVWLFFSAGRWNRYPFTFNERENVGEKSFQIYFRATDDSGRSWSATQAAPVERGFNCRANGIRLSSGELLLPVYQLRGEQTGVLKSADGGKTWRRHGAIRTPHGQEEPAIAELKDGAVLMILRSGGGALWKSLSRDKGETWTDPAPTSLTAARSSHSLLRLRDGLTHNPNAKFRTPLTLRIGDGEHWGTPLVLAEVPEVPPDSREVRPQVSYPSVTDLDDGSLGVVWSDIGISEERQWGDIRFARVRAGR